jgi:hypothetical protein
MRLVLKTIGFDVARWLCNGGERSWLRKVGCD